MNLKMRLDALQTLLHVSGNDEAARDLKRYRSQIIDLQGERNEIVHALWVRGDYGSPMTLTVRARGTLDQRKTGRKPDSIRALADRIAETAFKLQETCATQGVFFG
jgi:hypothetical protein